MGVPVYPNAIPGVHGACSVLDRRKLGFLQCGNRGENHPGREKKENQAGSMPSVTVGMEDGRW